MKLNEVYATLGVKKKDLNVFKKILMTFNVTHIYEEKLKAF